MSIRNCALSCSAFCNLKEVYDNRETSVFKLKAAGKEIILKLGSDVPDELIIAAGMAPVQVWADPEKPLTQTDVYLEYAFDPMVRAAFERIVDGTCAKEADTLVISNSTDVVVRTYLYLRELKRVEPEKAVPDVEFIDWLFTRNRMHQDRNEFLIRLFRKRLEEISGKTITDEMVAAAGKLCNENRAAIRRIDALRREKKITGCEALVIIGSAFFMDREAHTALVNKIADEAEGWPVQDGIKLFFTGSNQEDLVLYSLLEDSGFVVIGEDHDWGDRFAYRDYNEALAPDRAIVDRYMLREYSSKKALVARRVEALDREVDEAGAKAVVFYTNIYEEAASWDYPSQRNSLEARGIKTACFAKMAWPCKPDDEIRTKLADLSKRVKEV